MSRPVKVSDEFYQQLERIANEQGVPLQEALKRELDRRSSQIRQLESRQSELQKRLQEATQQVKSEKGTSQRAKENLKALQLNLDGLKRQLNVRTSERDEMLSVCDDWKCQSDQFESELEHTREVAGKTQAQYKALRFVLGIVAIVALGYGLWTLWRQTRDEEKDRPGQQGLQPWSYGV